MSHTSALHPRWSSFGPLLRAVAGPTRPAKPPATSDRPEPSNAARAASGLGHAEPLRRRGWSWQRLALVGILLLSATLNLLFLNREGYSNQYYAAAVLSMLQSWHNFFFVSFDPGGFVTVDKPPLGFWIQAASAKLLGFSGLSLLLPQALAGVASVAVLYRLVGRAFGSVAGLLAALMLALMPISVVTARNNTIDSLLVLAVLLATGAAFRATERGQLRWLLAAAAIVGLGFEIKMMQAYLVLPALFLLYLVAAPVRRLVRIGHLTLAFAVLLVVSLAWPVAVDLTPESQRPYVGSTSDNSAVSLAVGYNGLQRLLGRTDGRFDGTTQTDAGASGLLGDLAQLEQLGQTQGFNGGPGGTNEDGTPGPFRLLNQQLASQASWLLPLAILGLYVSGTLAWSRRRSLSRSRHGQAFIIWGAWLATTAAFFSVAEYWHRYYLVMLAPAVAALAAIGVWGGWRAFRQRRWAGWLLPLGFAATAAVQLHILADYGEWATRLTPVLLAGVVFATVVLLGVWLGGRRLAGLPGSVALSRLAAAVGVAVLLATPAVWSSLPVVTGRGGGGLPAAGPALQGGGFGGPGRPGGFGAPDGGFGGPDDGRPDGFGASSSQSDLVAYLQANQGSSKYLLAVSNANSAAPIILSTGQPAMALGGFLGSDPILTAQELAAKVQAGEVRFFQLGGGPGGSSDLFAWVQSSCQAVSISGANTTGAQSAGPGRFGGQLYDCGALQGSAS